ncbi:hypothetical protein, conserved [Entamoeba dispar SAW760]|uniref:Leucine-rich repeat containing protein n=1 Tax=Entamoeba dispar (strain ATCC PRA-260 / SAW760) TaxID=370354 RepID=B0EFN0_ENTDS|nr:uncharacterized protein EDI_271670 [Entamoeba dispar SAW760]EDR26661.1 hypothetical protein, conserved [Entamoeba dispar SAW760]|eukprot:EDR26661.1 hypothetical protein, conserved [Entamoeba dispar SAW760]
METPNLITPRPFLTIIQSPLPFIVDNSKISSNFITSKSCTSLVVSSNFGELSIPDLMVIALQLNQQTTKVFLSVNKKCKQAVSRLKINSFNAPLNALKKFFPGMETLSLINPTEIPKSKYRYKIYSSSPELFKMISSLEKYITSLHLIVQQNSSLPLKKLKSLIKLTLDFTKVSLQQLESPLLREARLFRSPFIKSFHIYCQQKDIISAQNIIEVFNRHLPIKIILIVEGLTFYQKGIDAVIDNDLLELKNVCVLPNGSYYIITANVVEEFKKYLPLSLKIKGTDDCVLLDLSGYDYLTHLTLVQQKSIKNLLLPQQLYSLKLEDASDSLVDYKRSNIKELILYNCTITKHYYSESLNKLTILHCNSEYLKIPIPIEGLSISYCNSLKEICIPSSLKKLGLTHCINLTKIKGLTHSNTLELELTYCPLLKKIHIPSSLNKLSITSCEKLNQNLVLRNVLIEEMKIISSPRFKVSEIPNTLRNLQIQDYCEKEIILPEFVTELRLSHCDKLEAIYFPRELKILQIYKCPLISFEGIENIYMNTLEVEGVQRIENVLLPLGLVKIAFIDCKYLRLLDGMADLTTLNELTISSCPQLNNLVLPKFITKLTINKCKNLTCIDGIEKLDIPFDELINLYYLLEHPLLPNNVTSLQLDGWNCLSLSNIFSLHLVDLTINNFSHLSSLTIPNSLITLSLCGCKSLQQLSFKSPLLKKLTINSCTSLKNVSFPMTLTYLVVIDCFALSFNKINTIPLYHLGIENITSLKGLKIPTTLKILQIAFCDRLNDISNLKKIDLKEIAFLSLYSLKKITFPTTMTNLVLENCDNLNKIKNLNNCPIQELKLSGLDSIKSISFPTTLTKLNINLCEEVSNLDNLYKCNISELSIFKCNKLSLLNLPQCITRLQIDSCNSIHELNLENYKIFELELTTCEQLTKIIFSTTIISLSVTGCNNLLEISNLESLDVPLDTVFNLIINLAHPILPLSFNDIQTLNAVTENFIENASQSINSSYTPQLSKNKSNRFNQPLNVLYDSPIISPRSPRKFIPWGLSPSPTFSRSPSPHSFKVGSPRTQKINSPRSFYIPSALSPTLDINDMFTISNWKCLDIQNLNVFSIDDLYVCNCIRLTKLEPPQTVTKLVIENCTSLQYLSLTPHLIECSIHFCSSINQLYIPQTLNELHLFHCEEINKLQSFENATKLINFSAKYCNQLRTLIIPNGLKKFQIECCDRLDEIINIENSLIEELVIIECDSLENITFPSTLNKLTIEKCYSLNKLPNLQKICPQLTRSMCSIYN